MRNDMADERTPIKMVERALESALFASRWILAPFYLGLALSLIVLLIKFIGELIHIAANAFSATESETILGVLALVDLSLTGSLIVIVIFSGYENFVSRIDHANHKDWPEWMGKIDFSGLKLKLLSSIVAISAIQLLKQFMSIQKVTDRDIMWLVIVHVVFVISSVLLALSDRLTTHGDASSKNPHGNGSDHAGTGGAGPDLPPDKKAASSHATTAPSPHVERSELPTHGSGDQLPKSETRLATWKARVNAVQEPDHSPKDDGDGEGEHQGQRAASIKRRLH